MQSAYLTSLPQISIRGMAGFQRQSHHYLPRAKVPPSELLLSLVFPDVDGWMGLFLAWVKR